LIPFLVLHLVPHCIDDMVLIGVDDLLEFIHTCVRLFDVRCNAQVFRSRNISYLQSLVECLLQADIACIRTFCVKCVMHVVDYVSV